MQDHLRPAANPGGTRGNSVRRVHRSGSTQALSWLWCRQPRPARLCWAASAGGTSAPREGI